MDTIFIREFRVDAWVGIYEWEKQRAQTLEMEIEIGIPGNEVGRTDNIHDTVHYGEVVQRITTELAERKFKLLEALAEHICCVVILSFATPWLARHGLGRLPGDITVRWKGRPVYIPITTTILLSLVLTLI